MDTGYVIEDSKGNQYVWVEVPQDTTVYRASTLALDLDSLSGDALTTAYASIENDLHTYTSTYRNGTSFEDKWYSEDVTGLTEDEYNTQKEKMLKSIYINGGFYIGRYGTGIDYSDGNRTLADDSTDDYTPVIKQNSYVYNFVTVPQAQELSESFTSELDDYTSSLLFGLQWDLTMRYLETNGATQDELKEDSTEWGNYYTSQYIINNTSAKYSTDSGTSYTDISTSYEKTEANSVILTTGASDEFSKQNIYDLGGNMWEWTLEVRQSDGISVERGGYAGISSAKMAANVRGAGNNSSKYFRSFRVALYKDEGIN